MAQSMDAHMEDRRRESIQRGFVTKMSADIAKLQTQVTILSQKVASYNKKISTNKPGKHLKQQLQRMIADEDNKRCVISMLAAQERLALLEILVRVDATSRTLTQHVEAEVQKRRAIESAEAEHRRHFVQKAGIVKHQIHKLQNPASCSSLSGSPLSLSRKDSSSLIRDQSPTTNPHMQNSTQCSSTSSPPLSLYRQDSTSSTQEQSPTSGTHPQGISTPCASSSPQEPQTPIPNPQPPRISTPHAAPSPQEPRAPASNLHPLGISTPHAKNPKEPQTRLDAASNQTMVKLPTCESHPQHASPAPLEPQAQPKTGCDNTAAHNSVISSKPPVSKGSFIGPSSKSSVSNGPFSDAVSSRSSSFKGTSTSASSSNTSLNGLHGKQSSTTSSNGRRSSTRQNSVDGSNATKSPLHPPTSPITPTLSLQVVPALLSIAPITEMVEEDLVWQEDSICLLDVPPKISPAVAKEMALAAKELEDGLYMEAAEHYYTAMALPTGRCKECVTNCALVLLMAQYNHECLLLCKDVMGLDPKFWLPYVIRARAYRCLLQHPEALQDLDTAMGLCPESAESIQREMTLVRLEQQTYKSNYEPYHALHKKFGLPPSASVTSVLDAYQKLKRVRSSSLGDTEETAGRSLHLQELKEAAATLNNYVLIVQWRNGILKQGGM